MVKRGSITGNLANRKKQHSKRAWTSATEIQKSVPLGRRQKLAFWLDCIPNELPLENRLAAEADVAEAAQWYNERKLGLGEKFLREVDQAVVRILENPLAFPVIFRRHEVRRVLTKRFPYRIFFSLKGDASRTRRIARTPR
jgi:toxin ParE1/3/4